MAKRLSEVYTQEQLDKVLQLYPNPNYSVYQISEITGVNRSTIPYIARINGLALRRPKKLSDSTKARKCKNCGRLIKIQDARYCPYCASDVRSEKSKTLELLGVISNVFDLFESCDLDDFERDIKNRDCDNHIVAALLNAEVALDKIEAYIKHSKE